MTWVATAGSFGMAIARCRPRPSKAMAWPRLLSWSWQRWAVVGSSADDDLAIAARNRLQINADLLGPWKAFKACYGMDLVSMIARS